MPLASTTRWLLNKQPVLLKNESFMKQADYLKACIPKLRLFVLNRTRNTDLTDEVVQETLLRTYHSTNLSNIQNPLAYMVTVAKTVLFDHWKSQPQTEPDVSLETLVDPTMPIEEQYLEDEKIKILANVLQNMPGLRQKVFKMRRLDGMSRKEIANELGISIEAVKKHINRAMVELTICAEKNDWKF
jgi:RNA polymerase sigma-70 factor (ECF subfamily)